MHWLLWWLRHSVRVMEGNCLRAVVEAELLVEVPEVELHRVDRDVEFCREFGVGATLGQRCQQRFLALGEAFARVALQPAHIHVGKHHAAGRHGCRDIEQLLFRRIARQEGGSVTVTAMVGDRLVADAEIVFVHLNSDDPQLSRIDQKNFVFRMNLLDILTVGKAGSGEKTAAQ